MEFRVSNTFTSGKGELPVAEHRCPGRDQLQDTILEIRGKLRSLLLERGAFLLTGCEIRNGSDFADFVTQFSGKKLLSYAGGSSPRTALNGTRVYTST